MDNGMAHIVHRLRPLGLIPVIALGLLSTLASGGGGGDGSIPSSPGTIELLETSFDATEGTIVNILVSRSGGNAGAVSVDYATADDTALGGPDYPVSSGTLTWADGLSGNQTISIPITNDNSVEPSESFTVTLSNVSRAMLGTNSSATVNIVDTGSTRLSDLSMSAGKFDQIFQPGLTDYTATLSLLRSTTTITATTEDPDATVTVKGVAVASGVASDKLSLSQGVNTIDVIVTTVDGVTAADYSIEVTRESAAHLSQEAYLKPPDPEGTPDPDLSPFFLGFGGFFGSAISFNQDTLAIGAWGRDVAGLEMFDNGAVYVLVRDPAGVWSQQAKLTDPLPDLDEGQEHFGIAVALAETTLFVAKVPGIVFSHSPIGTGTVYPYDGDLSGTWVAQSSVHPTRSIGPNPIGQFGLSMSTQNDTLVVGAPLGNAQDSDPFSLSDRTGDAFIYHRDQDGGWNQVLHFLGPAPDPGAESGAVGVRDSIGAAVALDVDTIAIGVPGEDSAPSGITGDPFDNSTADSGAVFILRREANDTWSQTNFIKAPNGGIGDRFGSAVAISGDTLVVSAPQEDSGAVGIDGNQADDNKEDSGAVYVFSRGADGVWRHEAYIKASNTDAGDEFGSSITLMGDTLIVGAPGEDSGATGVNGDPLSNTATDAGAVYVFTRDADRRWTQVAYLKASNTDPGDRFGTVALAEDSIAVGAPEESSLSGGLNADQSNNGAVNGGAGAVYVFR